MSVEDILKQKGAGVATIAPDVSVKRAADWLHRRVSIGRRSRRGFTGRRG